MSEMGKIGLFAWLYYAKTTTVKQEVWVNPVLMPDKGVAMLIYGDWCALLTAILH